MRRERVLLLITSALAIVLAVALVVVLVQKGGEPEATAKDKGQDRDLPKAVTTNDPVTDAPPLPADVKLPTLDLSAANRRTPIAGLPDWSKAGYRDGAGLPTDNDFNQDAACQVTPEELKNDFDVRPDDNADDSAGLQQAIDQLGKDCSPKASYDKLSLLRLPPGQLDVTRELKVDADYTVVRGAGGDPESGTRIVFRPDQNTRYDTLTKDGGDWEEDDMEAGDGKGGWLWPGRGLFRVQSRAVHEDYQKDYADAPANRKDILEGSVNVHWKAGVELREKQGGNGYAARTGDTVIPLADDWAVKRFQVGGYVNIRAANTMSFYEQQQALPTEHELQNLHMRQQIFQVEAVDKQAGTITIDKPLEYDVPVDSTSDGSEEIDGDTYESKASPLVDPVLGVGFENLSMTQVVPDAKAEDAVHNYGNLAPADEMHGIVFKWAANSWVRGVRMWMTGSHPIVTEEAKNLQIQDNYLNGAWNKGKGGNGYLRGSRVWDSVYARNVTRNLRHFTFQWSSSGNVVIGNDFDSDLNLHGGWERRNLFELNTVRVPFEHGPNNCTANCGSEGGADEGDATWYPIWWAAGQKAVKWSGASGPQNVFFNNTLAKQKAKGGGFEPYYSERGRIYQFGWNGSQYQHLEQNGKPIADWAGRETADFSGHGVDTSKTDQGASLFLKTVG